MVVVVGFIFIGGKEEVLEGFGEGDVEGEESFFVELDKGNGVYVLEKGGGEECFAGAVDREADGGAGALGAALLFVLWAGAGAVVLDIVDEGKGMECEVLNGVFGSLFGDGGEGVFEECGFYL